MQTIKTHNALNLPESRTRSLAKALSWQAIGLVIMTFLGWQATGNIATAGGLALSSALTGFISFILHERIWARIRWGRR